jgi:hypothetical protein
VTAFDAASWIREFEAVGGSYTVSADGRLTTGYPIMGASVPEQEECCRLVCELSADPARVAAVRMHVMGRP